MIRVALVEDDRTMVRLLTALLRLDGFDVHVVGDPGDIGNAVRRIMPDALILDVVLAKHNGLEILDRIRRMDIGAALYILMISGIDVRDLCLERGADDFLLKPFVPEELTRKLHSRQAKFT